MSSFEDAADRFRLSERVSIPAVVVPDGADPTPYLQKAGILNPVTIPFAPANGDLPPGSMGTAWTPGLTAVLETIDDEPSAGEPGDPLDMTGQEEAEQEAAEPAVQTANLPGAFGRQPLAPVWRPAGS